MASIPPWLWAGVQPTGTPPILPGLRWLDHVPTAPGKAMELFITGWYPTETEPPPAAAIPGSVPPVLADFYRLAERRPAILGGQNGWAWSIPWDLEAADAAPEVRLTEGDEPAPEQEPLSTFLLQFSPYEAAMAASYLAFPMPSRSNRCPGWRAVRAACHCDRSCLPSPRWTSSSDPA